MRFYRAKIISLISVLTVGLFNTPVTAVSPAKTVNLKWKDTPFTLTYEPDSKFISGKKIGSTLLNSEAKLFCKYNYGFVGLSVVGASGKDLGYSGTKSKLIKTFSKVVSGSWVVNNFGEDEYRLTITCSGIMASPVKGISNSYSLYLHTEFPCLYKKTCSGGFYSPSYTSDELDANNWIIEVQFGADWDRENSWDTKKNIWKPAGIQEYFPD